MIASHALHRRWLRVSAFVIGFFGPALTLATLPGAQEPARWGLDLLTFPLDGFPTYHADEMRFLSALTGGFLVGWAVTVWCLSDMAYHAAPEAVRKSVVYGACAWFLFDSVGSVTSGHWPNALWNVLVLIILVGPMWWPARDETIQGES